MKKLIFAEKPSAMRQFIQALEPTAKAVLYKKPYVYYYEGQHYIFASGQGHLFETKMPEEIDNNYKKWTSSVMTFPDLIPIKPSKDGKAYFQCLQELLKTKQIDELVVATDPDREGQLIWGLIARNINTNVPISRVWIKEWTSKGLLTAFQGRRPNSEYKSLEDAGLGRLQADFVIGMNGTRINTVTFGGYKNLINEGRVQSPTRFLVADLENQIKTFKPEDYGVVTLNTTSEESTPLTLKSNSLEPNVAKSLQSLLTPNKKFKLEVEQKTTKKGCPMLYKTNDILMDAGKKLGLSTDKTTEILQKLYQDYGLTTYPRTEIQQISASAAKDVMKIVKSLEGLGLVDDIIDEIKSHKLTFQKHLINTKGGEMPHEAITPTFDGNPASMISHLSSDEKNVYLLVIKRFLQGFYPPAIIDETKVETIININGEQYPFKANGKTIVDSSWMKISGIPNDSVLPLVKNGKDYDYVSHKMETKKTTPPARFNEASLLNAMENAARYVDDKDDAAILKSVKGIGTGATRSGIIHNLYKSGFLIKKGKTIMPTAKCMEWYEKTPDSPLKNPVMTAHLEGSLSEVESGNKTLKEFMNEVYEQVEDLAKDAINAPRVVITSEKKAVSKSGGTDDLGVCPFCGKTMRESEKSYYCPGYKEGCQFTIWKTVAGKKISKSTAKTLIKKGYTGKLKGFKSKTGKPFEAKLKVNQSTHKVEFDF